MHETTLYQRGPKLLAQIDPVWSLLGLGLQRDKIYDNLERIRSPRSLFERKIRVTNPNFANKPCNLVEKLFNQIGLSWPI
ncbi:hypothetical protein NC652_018504 [Populus alba x Populus x berolinensis]|nr:hypothetical protein NC652_018501 [Populus alba x Populus x berolinensis]KAJ6915865.1 hypothetical protein NC652_018504 [Populus alba x Populus x berolinensis]